MNRYSHPLTLGVVAVSMLSCILGTPRWRGLSLLPKLFGPQSVWMAPTGSGTLNLQNSATAITLASLRMAASSWWVCCRIQTVLYPHSFAPRCVMTMGFGFTSELPPEDFQRVGMLEHTHSMMVSPPSGFPRCSRLSAKSVNTFMLDAPRRGRSTVGIHSQIPKSCSNPSMETCLSRSGRLFRFGHPGGARRFSSNPHRAANATGITRRGWTTPTGPSVFNVPRSFNLNPAINAGPR